MEAVHGAVTMTQVRFVITEVAKVAARRGVLVTGRWEAGTIRKGMTLHDFHTGAAVRVANVEFLLPENMASGTTTILVDETPAASRLAAGGVLVSR